MKEYDLDHEKTFISAFQAGEEKVFRYVFEKFYSSLCVYCLRLIREEWVAADLVQEAFVKLWENVSGWANTSCRFDFSQERSLCLSYVYVQW